MLTVNKYAMEVIKELKNKGINGSLEFVQKTNTTLPAIIVRYGNVAPAFYIDIDRPIDDFVDYIANFKPESFNVDGIIEALSNPKYLVKNVKIRLVNTAKNTNNEFSSFDLGNGLSAQFYIEIAQDRNVVLKKEIMKKAGITAKELFESAIDNIEPEIISMSDYLHMPLDMPMYIISNPSGKYGAAGILAKGMYNRLYDLIGDFVILPSSVHELIAVPAGMPEYLDIVHAVNTEVLSEMDYLSDDIYTLDESGNLAIA